ncbi:MAG: hypothetical protein KDD58_04795 [Bdellovibrionales bacterium]|nr:hypothetical protein [Bdellovibrionales bacterium]
MKKRVLVVAPGRGTYTKDTLNYLSKFPTQTTQFVKQLDEWKKQSGELTITELDQTSTFKNQVHTKGENASVLIFACSYADFLNLDPNEYEIVAVTGNSMGWYSALILAGAMNLQNGYTLINTMGSMMKKEVIGGQIIYPFTHDDWTYDFHEQEKILNLIIKCREEEHGLAFPSIYLGGYLVIGGDQKGLSWLMKTLPQKEHFPFQLINHAAFHTPLMEEVSARAFQLLKPDLFQTPQYPLIDGRGKIWQPYSTSTHDLHNYTLAHQVFAPYNFTQAISVGLKEFAPDNVILLGPGNTLGGSIGQIIVNEKWLGIDSKSSFQARQKEQAFLVSLGL